MIWTRTNPITRRFHSGIESGGGTSFDGAALHFSVLSILFFRQRFVDGKTRNDLNIFNLFSRAAGLHLIGQIYWHAVHECMAHGTPFFAVQAVFVTRIWYAMTIHFRYTVSCSPYKMNRISIFNIWRSEAHCVWLDSAGCVQRKWQRHRE